MKELDTIRLKWGYEEYGSSLFKNYSLKYTPYIKLRSATLATIFAPSEQSFFTYIYKSNYTVNRKRTVYQLLFNEKKKVLALVQTCGVRISISTTCCCHVCKSQNIYINIHYKVLIIYRHLPRSIKCMTTKDTGLDIATLYRISLVRKTLQTVQQSLFSWKIKQLTKYA